MINLDTPKVHATFEVSGFRHDTAHILYRDSKKSRLSVAITIFSCKMLDLTNPTCTPNLKMPAASAFRGNKKF